MGSEGSVDAWLVVAERDLVMIRKALEGPDPQPGGAAFHCQQAAEKLVKTVMVAEGINPPKSHDIAMLVARLPDDHPLRHLLDRLDRYTEFVGTYRYPGPGLLDAVPEEPAVDEVASWLAEIEGIKLQVIEFLRTR